MSYPNFQDVLVLVYKGQHFSPTPGTLLGSLNVASLSLYDNQVGGVGAADFVVKAAWESAMVANLLAPNLVRIYLRADSTTATVASGDSTITLGYPTRFSIGQEVALYNGNQWDLAVVKQVHTTTLTLSGAVFHNYGIGTDLLVRRYQGMIAKRQRDVNLDPTTTVQTIGYFNQADNFVEDTFNGGGLECGYVLYQLLSNHASEMDLSLNPANFIMSTQQGLATGTTILHGASSYGTGVPYFSTNTQAKTSSIISDIISTANTGASGITYTAWADEFGYAHFGVVNNTLVALASSYTDIDLLDVTNGTATYQGPDGIYDSIGGFVLIDQDTSQLSNVAKVTGGSDPSTNQSVDVLVENTLSVNLYGQVEGTLSQPNMTDPNDLAEWAFWQVENSSFPNSQFDLTLSTVGSFLNCRNVLNITGFSDGSNQKFNPFTIVTTWDATSPGNFTQQIQGGVCHPDVTKIMRDIAREHFVPVHHRLNKHTNFRDRFVTYGLDATVVGPTLVISSGNIAAKVKVAGVSTLTDFAVSTYTFAASGNGAYRISFFFANLDGTQAASPQIVAYSGTHAQNYSGGLGNFNERQIIPLYDVYVLNGAIMNPDDLRNVSGAGHHHLQGNPNPGSSPIVTNVVGPTYTDIGATEYNAYVSFTVDQTLNSTWLKGLYLMALNVGESPDKLKHGHYIPPAEDYTGNYM